MENRFFIEQKPFMGLLASMQPICTRRTTVEATQSILIQVGHKELVLKSTDLEISLQSSYAIQDGKIEEPRSFLVSGKRLFDLVKELDGTIELVLKNNQLALKSGSVDLSLNIKDAEYFPPFPERIENLLNLESPLLLDMLSKVGFIIPQNNANPALNGLYLEMSSESMTMTATDGHCLAQVGTTKYHLDEPKKWLLPRRAVFEIKKLLESSKDATVFLGLCGNQLVFSGESFNFFTKLLADPFPQYESILQRDGFQGAVVDRSALIKTLRRSSCLLSGQFIATSFGFSQKELNVSMENKEVGMLAEQLPLSEFEGQDLTIRFYAPYLLGGLQVLTDDAVHLSLKNPSKPIIFESKTDDISMLYLVMPVSPTVAG